MDILFGDPNWLVSRISHPVILFGKSISKIEKIERKILPNTNKGLFFGGILLLLCTIIFWNMFYGIAFILIGKFSIELRNIFEIFLSYQLLATKSLQTESMKVYNALKTKDIAESRKQISYLVGRDTSELSEEGIIKATIETVAENTTDGVIAPLFYLAVFGIHGIITYKIVNTLDSMVGYRNEKYEFLGKASAICDDILNFVPARISALIMLIIAPFLRLDFKNAWKIFCRDRFAHKSPNSAQTESVVAGGLSVELGGSARYFGVWVEKPTIGDKIRPVNCEDILTVNRWLFATANLFVIVIVI